MLNVTYVLWLIETLGDDFHAPWPLCSKYAHHLIIKCFLTALLIRGHWFAVQANKWFQKTCFSRWWPLWLVIIRITTQFSAKIEHKLGAPMAVLQKVSAPNAWVTLLLCPKVQCSYGCAPNTVLLVPASALGSLATNLSSQCTPGNNSFDPKTVPITFF